MQLKQLLEKTTEELTDDELEKQLSALKRLKLTNDNPRRACSKSVVKSFKSNKEKQLIDLLANLTDEQKLALNKLI